MTNVLLAIAIVLFACLLGVGIFCLFLYRYEKDQEKWNERTDEIKAEPGKYHKVSDIDSVLPSSCVTKSPFGYRYDGENHFTQAMQIKNRLDKLETRIDEIEAIIWGDEDEPNMSLAERVKQLEDEISNGN